MDLLSQNLPLSSVASRKTGRCYGIYGLCTQNHTGISYRPKLRYRAISFGRGRPVGGTNRYGLQCLGIYLHCAFQLFGSIYEESSECLQEWKGAQRAPRWFRTTFIRSCWPLKIYVGGMYYADRQMSLTLNIEILSKIVETVLAS